MSDIGEAGIQAAELSNAEMNRLESQIADMTLEISSLEESNTNKSRYILQLQEEVARLEQLLNPKPAEPVGWKMHYETAFADLAGWTVRNNQTQSNDNSVNMAANVIPGPNGLDVWGRRQSGLSRPFSSGEIEGHGPMVVPNYFRAEVIGTIMDVSGLWPSLFWIRPEAGGDGSNGEFDLMEFMAGLFEGAQRRIAITAHNQYNTPTQPNVQDPWKAPIYWTDLANPSITAEHTYTMEKTPGMIKVWLDGETDKAVYFGTAPEVLENLPQNGVTAPKAWWNRIMEAPDRTWYPRITLQIGDGSVNGGKKVVPNPPATWQESKMTVRSLKLWVPA